MSEFQRPSMAVGFSPDKHPEWLGKLFMIRPNYVDHTNFGDPTADMKKVINAFVVILDLPNPETGMPTVIDGATIGGAALVPQLQDKVNSLVLGRMEKSAPQPGKNPAYKLNPNFTAEDEALGDRWLKELGPVPPLPTPPAAAPEPAPQWGQAPAQQPPAPPAQQWGQPAPAAPQGPPADVWAGTNAAPAPTGWGQPQAPAQAPVAAPAAPVPAQGWGAPQAPAQPQQWGQQPTAAPAPQNPELLSFLNSRGVTPTPDMDNATLEMIAKSLGYAGS